MTADDAQESEFDDVAAWTADALRPTDPWTRTVGACRGSGGPSALAWLAESLELGPNTRLLDVGSGLGGPAAWAAAHYRVRPFGAEPMDGAVRGATQLFGEPALVALADALPFATGTFDAAWSLGVLDTLERPDLALAEIRRCLVSGGRFGTLAYVADEPIPEPERPTGNTFPTTDDLERSVEDAGFVVVDRASHHVATVMPDRWSTCQDEIEDAVARAHGEDDRWREARDNEQRFASLLDDGRVRAVLLHARRV